MKLLGVAATLLCALASSPGHSAHTYKWVEPFVALEVDPDRRTERIVAALERVPDCIQERLNLAGAHVTLIGASPPKQHPMHRQLARDFLTRGWRVLAAPFVRIQGRAYPHERSAFVRRGARGAAGRSRLFTRWIPLTGRGEQTALHEYGHLVAFTLGIAAGSDFHALWARHSPTPIVDALSPRNEGVKKHEWFARAFADFHESDISRARLDDDLRDYLRTLEEDVHRGAFDDHVLELARLSSRNPYLAAARTVGERLLPAQLAGELRDRGAWGLGFYGQLWYSIQSTALRERHGSVYELLEERRERLVANGLVERAGLVHLSETCGDLAQAPLCRTVHENRARIEIWHPCLGTPIEGCLVSYGPTEALLERELGSDGPRYPWVTAERHRDIAIGRLPQRVALVDASHCLAAE